MPALQTPHPRAIARPTRDRADAFALCMIGTPPCTRQHRHLQQRTRPAAILSSLTLVERRETAALRPFSVAICAVTGAAPSMR